MNLKKILFLFGLILIFLFLGLFLAKIFQNSKLAYLLYTCKKEVQPYTRLRCLKSYFEHYTYAYSARDALREAQRLKKTRVIDDCHLASHYIGGATLSKNSFDIGRSFASCGKGCIEGCFHGVMEKYVEHNGGITTEGLTHLCDSVSNSSALLRRQCIHGAGHGILGHGDTELVSAVDTCRKFASAFDIDICLGGVFMQQMNNYSAFSKELLIKELPHMCESLSSERDNQLMSMCTSAIGEGLMFYSGHNISESEFMCKLLNIEYQEICIQAVQDEATVNKLENQDV